jgi:hypothetical protein
MGTTQEDVMSKRRERAERDGETAGRLRGGTVVLAVVAGASALLAAPATALLNGELGGSSDHESEGRGRLEVELPHPPDGGLPSLPELPVPAPGEGDGSAPEIPEIPEIPLPVPEDGDSGLPVPLPVPPGEGDLPVPVPEIPAGPGTGEVGIDVGVEARVEVGATADGGAQNGGNGNGEGGDRSGGPGAGGEVDARTEIDLDADLEGGGAGSLPELPADGGPLDGLDPTLLALFLENPEMATNPAVLRAIANQTPAGDLVADVPIEELPTDELPTDGGDDSALSAVTGALPLPDGGATAPLAGTGLAGLSALGLFGLKRRFFD